MYLLVSFFFFFFKHLTFNMQDDSYAHQGWIYLIKNTVKIVLFRSVINNCFLFEYILKCNLFLWFKAEFSASLLQSSVSHDPSEIILIYWFASQETFIIIISVNNSYAVSNFHRNFDNFFLESIIYRKSIRAAFIWNRIFCNIINLSTVTFDQVNASLLNKR